MASEEDVGDNGGRKLEVDQGSEQGLEAKGAEAEEGEAEVVHSHCSWGACYPCVPRVVVDWFVELDVADVLAGDAIDTAALEEIEGALGDDHCFLDHCVGEGRCLDWRAIWGCARSAFVRWNCSTAHEMSYICFRGRPFWLELGTGAEEWGVDIWVWEGDVLDDREGNVRVEDGIGDVFWGVWGVREVHEGFR